MGSWKIKKNDFNYSPNNETMITQHVSATEKEKKIKKRQQQNFDQQHKSTIFIMPIERK